MVIYQVNYIPVRTGSVHISPYPNLWLNTRFLLLEWLRLVFEEIVNRNRLTERHFVYHPNSECSHPIGNFVDDSSNFHRKRHWTIVMHLFLFADFRDGQRPYTIIYLALSFFMWNCCATKQVLNIVWKTLGRGLLDQCDWCVIQWKEILHRYLPPELHQL